MITQPHNDEAFDAFLSAIHEASAWLWSNMHPHDRWGHMLFIQKLLSGLADEWDRNPLNHAEWISKWLTKDCLNDLGVVTAYPELLNGSCIGVTKHGTRCSRPGTVTGKSGQAYCQQHIDEIPGVWESIIPLLRQAGRQLEVQYWAAQQLRQPSEAGSVYFLWDSTKYMKIGHTDRMPSKRADEIEKDKGRTILAPTDVNWYRIELLDSVSGNKGTEKTFHNALSQHRADGEWFIVSAAMLHQLQSIGVDLIYLLKSDPWLRRAS